MSLLDKFIPGRDRKVKQTTKSALEAAKNPQAENAADDGAINRLVYMLLDLGLDGAGPLSSAEDLAKKALEAEQGNSEDAIARIKGSTIRRGGVGGFVTGLGGFVTMPIALPVNLAEFYIQAVRMVGAIASLRGYDVKQQEIRTAVLLTLIGSRSEEVLKKAGMATGGGALGSFAFKRLPPSVLMVVNKAVGFRLMRGVGERFLSRLGRGIPLAGGVVGAGLDAWMMKRIAETAIGEFPQVETIN